MGGFQYSNDDYSNDHNDNDDNLDPLTYAESVAISITGMVL